MKSKILALLRESADYISGQELCEFFGVSRTAVWKAINQLKKEGYQIEAVQNKGYKLVGMSDVLSKNELVSRMKTRWAGREVYYYDETGSTNTDAKRLAEEGAPHGTLVVTDRQNAGKGRRGRNWESPKDTNIYYTILLRPQISPLKAPMLTLVMAHSVTVAIEKVTGAQAGIKWPNDIVLNKKKICGILTEMTLESDYIQNVVIGVGINVKKQQFPAELVDKATSIGAECGKEVSRAALIQAIMEQFEKDYDKFTYQTDLTDFVESYNSHLVNKDVQVRVLDPKGEFTGIAKGINEKGELLVERQDHTMIEVYAGEVSVRGIYGYV